MRASVRSNPAIVLAAYVACGASLVPVPAVAAGPPLLWPCAQTTDPVHASAIKAAEDWRDTRWAIVTSAAGTGRVKISPAAKIGQPRITAYLIPPPPPAPLGIGSFARANDLGAGSDVPITPIAGFAEVAQQLCLTGAPGADGNIFVQFVGRALRFNENGQGWSKPLRRPSILHALIVARPSTDAPWSIADQPEAPTALIPGSKLSLPTATDMSLSLAAAPRRR